MMSWTPRDPLAKIAYWIALSAVLALLVQTGAWILGIDFYVLASGRGGRGVLLVIALMTLLGMMASDPRGWEDYGVVVAGDWRRSFLVHVAIGGAAMLAFLLICGWMGAARLDLSQASGGRLFKGLLSAASSPVLAATQLVIFSGYLLTLIRDRYPRWLAVVLPAMLFAVLGRLHRPAELFTAEVLPLLAGITLATILLSVLRLQSGSIVAPTGLMAGWLAVDKLTDKLRLVQTVDSSPWAGWLLPNNDPRQSLAFAALMVVAIAVGCLVIQMRGEGRLLVKGAAVDSDFKRIFPFGSLFAFYTLDVWMGRLIAARFQVGWEYLPRLVVSLACSTVNTVLSLPERLVLPWVLQFRPVRPPVFILGVHRSGTTHLHNLLALDERFHWPTVHHIINPVGCVVSGWLLSPIVARFLPRERPMDGVAFHLLAPQEDEFGMTGSCGMSPYWGTAFPRQWASYDRYLLPQQLPEQQQRAWRRKYDYFLRQVACWTSRRLLLKNPYNTGRLELLRNMYPGAQFVHIHRRPEDVYRSNQHLAREGHVMNQMQDQPAVDSYMDRFLGNYRLMEESFYAAADRCPAGEVVDVSFEQLEQSPLEVLEQVYRGLGWEMSDSYRKSLTSYLEGLSSYRKNVHKPTPAELQRQIQQELGPLLRRWSHDHAIRAA